MLIARGTAAILCVTGLLVLAACGGDDGSSSLAGTGQPGRTATTAPAATDDASVRPHIEDLLARYDEVVNEILADPSVASDPGHPLVQQYLDLFEPDSEFAQQALEGWAANAADGISIRPYSEDHPTNVSRLDGEIEVVSENEVSFPTCAEHRQLIYEGGEVQEGLPLVEEPGRAVAVRVDGEWRLRRRDVFIDVVGCDSEGSEGA